MEMCPEVANQGHAVRTKGKHKLQRQ